MWDNLKRNLRYFSKKLLLKKNRSPLVFLLYSLFSILLLFCLAIFGYLTYEDYKMSQKIDSYKKLTYEEFSEKAKSGNIASQYNLRTNYIFSPPQSYSIYTTKDGKKFKADFLLEFKDDEELKPFVKKIQTLDRETNYGSIRNIVVSYIFFIFFLLFVLFLAIRFMSFLNSGKNFSPKTLNFNIRFNDIIGYDKVKEEFEDIKNQLLNKKKYNAANVELPKGILLTGPPGVGKTMLAKALANELDCSFFTASGADFVEMYVGVGPKRVTALFQKASLSKPSVIFIDEIDAIGSRDSAYLDSESQKTINQLLVEMDGVEETADILVVAATNSPEKIDKALLRPGRFDKTVYVGLPDKDTRSAMLKHFFEKYNMSNDVSIEKIALQTSGSSGAEIENIMKQANTIAFKKDPDNVLITKQLIEQAMEEIALGSQTYKNSNEEERKRIAYHELGHAFMTHLKLPNHHIHKISIIGRGMGLGYTLHTSLEDKKIYTKKDVTNQIQVFLAGRAAEEIFIGDVSSGAYDDLQKTNELMYKLVAKFGMSDCLGLVVEMDNNNTLGSHSDKQELITKEMRERLDELYRDTKRCLESYYYEIEELAQLLLDKNEIHGDEMKKLINEIKKV